MLSSNAAFNEQGQAAIIRDLEKLYLQVNGPQNTDMGGAAPQSAVDQTVQQGGAGTTPYVTQDELNAALAGLGGGGGGSLPDPVTIAHGGTGATTAINARSALGLGTDSTGTNLSSISNATTARGNIGIKNSNYDALTTPGTTTWTVPAGVTRVRAVCIGGGGGGVSPATSAVNTTVGWIAASSGGATTGLIEFLGGSTNPGGAAGALLVVDINVTPGGSLSVTVGAAGAVDGAGGSSSVGYGNAAGGSTSYASVIGGRYGGKYTFPTSSTAALVVGVNGQDGKPNIPPTIRFLGAYTYYATIADGGTGFSGPDGAWYGSGGSGGSPGTAATAGASGAVFIFY